MNERGVAAVEKLMVLLLVICFIGAIVAVMGPALVAKYQWAADLLSFGSAPTIAQREALAKAEPTSVGIYVLMFVIAVVVFGGFFAPVLFPRAHRYRSELIQKFARKSTMMTALADVSLSDQYSLEELRAMAKNAKRFDIDESEEEVDHWQRAIDPEATASVTEIPVHSNPAPAPILNDPLAKVRALDGFEDVDDEDPTKMLPPPNFQSGSDDAIPFEDVPSAQQEVPIVHAGRASDDATVRAVVDDRRISEVLAAAAAQPPNIQTAGAVPNRPPVYDADATDEDDVTKVAIDRPTFGTTTPDAETTAHKSLRSRLADRRLNDD